MLEQSVFLCICVSPHMLRTRYSQIVLPSLDLSPPLDNKDNQHYQDNLDDQDDQEYKSTRVQEYKGT